MGCHSKFLILFLHIHFLCPPDTDTPMSLHPYCVLCSTQDYIRTPFPLYPVSSDTDTTIQTPDPQIVDLVLTLILPCRRVRPAIRGDPRHVVQVLVAVSWRSQDMGHRLLKTTTALSRRSPTAELPCLDQLLMNSSSRTAILGSVPPRGRTDQTYLVTPTAWT